MAAPNTCRVGLAVALAGCISQGACAQDAPAANNASPVHAAAWAFENLPSGSQILTSEDFHPSSTYTLSLEEARSRALQTSPVMDLASLQVSAKCHALQAARKDFLPKLLNSFSYFHFDSDLGTVITTPGIFNPANTIAVPVIEQDATMYTAAAIQPITPLLKVREAVNISAADVGSAKAQREFARRELLKGVEQLYFGLLATTRIKAGLEQAVAGAQQMAAASQAPDVQISLVQARQGLLSVDTQLLELTGQMNSLVDLPLDTQLELQEPAPPTMPFLSAEEAVAAAISTSPKLKEARRQVDKAEAALRLAHADYVPTVNAYGFYVNQDSTPTIQDDFTGVGVSASYLFEWGKKNETYRASMATVALARQNLRKEMQDASLDAAKAYHAANQAEQAFGYARELSSLSQQVQPPASDPVALKAAVQARLDSEVAAIKAELDYRNAVVELRSLTGQAE